MTLDREAIDVLSSVLTATITTILLKHGLRNVWTTQCMDAWSAAAATRLTAYGRSCIHVALIPAREDLATPASWASPRSTRAAIEAMPEGCIAVVDAMGVTHAGIFGDILCARMKKRNVKALVTDGVVRDVSGVLATNLPVWCQGNAAPPSVAGLTFVNWQEPVACGGVAVYPDGAVVIDDDGARRIPAALIGEVVAVAMQQENLENRIMQEVEKGVPLPGLYPPNEETKARYEAAKRLGLINSLPPHFVILKDFSRAGWLRSIRQMFRLSELGGPNRFCASN